MGRKEATIVKTQKSDIISKHSEARYGVNFGHGSFLKHDACFARFHERLKETPPGTSMQYILRYEKSWGIFDYDALFRNLNKMFGTHFKILRVSSGENNVRIIDIQETEELPDNRLRHIAYTIICVLLRAIDAEYIVTLWKPSRDTEEVGKIYPIKKWEDVLYHYYTFGMSGHAVNDDIRDIKRNNSKRLFKIGIENYFQTIQKAFGGKFDFTKKGVKSRLNEGFKPASYSWRTAQTPSFRLIEKIVKELS